MVSVFFLDGYVGLDFVFYVKKRLDSLLAVVFETVSIEFIMTLLGLDFSQYEAGELADNLLVEKLD